MTAPDSGIEAQRRAEAVEIDLGGGGMARGLLWPAPDRAVVFLHAPEDDLDAWDDVPAFVAGATGFAALALDLPGCGMSDDPGGPWDLAGLLAAAGGRLGLPPSRCVVAALGRTALDALSLDPQPPMAGLVAVAPPEADDLPRTPRLPKLLLASSADAELLQATRALANRAGGWAIVSAITPGENDPWLIRGPWGIHVREQIAGFARDCLLR